MKKSVIVYALLISTLTSFGQGAEEGSQYNPNSLLAIPKYEQLFKVRVWRNVDLREKQNKGFFARGNEITKLVMDGVRSGELADVYINDSLTTRKSKEQFFKDMLSQAGETYPAWAPTAQFYQGDRVTINGKNYEALVDNTGKNPETSTDDWQVTAAGQAIYFLPGDIYQMQIMEDVIFDKRRSRLYYDIQAIRLQAFDQNTNTYKDIGWFKYLDLEKLFRNHPDEAMWFNRYNTAENKNYADAFLLRLFHGTIDKVENPDNDRIEDVYARNGRPYKEAIWAMEWEEMRLMEREHNLWEY
jgi:gliding motility associated protien GldN